jgi:hypothetical protein
MAAMRTTIASRLSHLERNAPPGAPTLADIGRRYAQGGMAALSDSDLEAVIRAGGYRGPLDDANLAKLARGES